MTKMTASQEYRLFAKQWRRAERQFDSDKSEPKHKTRCFREMERLDRQMTRLLIAACKAQYGRPKKGFGQYREDIQYMMDDTFFNLRTSLRAAVSDVAIFMELDHV